MSETLTSWHELITRNVPEKTNTLSFQRHPLRPWHWLELLVWNRQEGRQDWQGQWILCIVWYRVLWLRLLRRGQWRTEGVLSRVLPEFPPLTNTMFQVAIVHHLDMPIMRQRAFHIAPGTENQIPITPTLYTANPQVRRRRSSPTIFLSNRKLDWSSQLNNFYLSWQGNLSLAQFIICAELQ